VSEELPGSAETTRRGFFKLAIAVIAAINGIILGIPVLGSLVGAPPKTKNAWSRLGEVASLPEGRPVEMKFGARNDDAYHVAETLYSVWVVKEAPDRVAALSPICTHLGCHFLWSDERERFECPCHASVFSADGRVLYGPAPRRLDSLPVKIEKGVLFVQWQRFKSGIVAKVAV
jgi:menaquinol-cytochrome c reductase iron-sulfur subunit